MRAYLLMLFSRAAGQVGGWVWPGCRASRNVNSNP